MKTTAPHRKPSFGSLEQRVANQERRINQGERSGRLTAEEASGLRAKLTDVQKQIESSGFDAGGAGRRMEQQKALNGLSKEIRSAKHNDTIDPAKRMDNIDKRIANGLKDGSLTESEATALQDKAKSLRSELEAATTPEAKAALTQKLEGLSREVRSERHDGELDAGKRTANFAERIQKGLADGSLTQQEANRLSERLGGVDSMAQNGQVNAGMFNGLNNAIWRNRHDAQVDTGKASTALGGRIDSLEQSGKLTGEQANDFRSQLEALGKDGERAVGPRLNILRERLNTISV